MALASSEITPVINKNVHYKAANTGIYRDNICRTFWKQIPKFQTEFFAVENFL